MVEAATPLCLNIRWVYLHTFIYPPFLLSNTQSHLPYPYPTHYLYLLPPSPLTLTKVMHVVSAVGFVMQKEEQRRCTYTRCNKSMMHTTYDAALFVATKPDK